MSITYDAWKTRFTSIEFDDVSEELFDMLLVEAQMEMGLKASRWLNDTFYIVAQGYLISHLATITLAQNLGDAQALAPIRTSDVDGVLVEYGISREMINNPSIMATTSYGQQYLRYRRMAFGGPRVV